MFIPLQTDNNRLNDTVVFSQSLPRIFSQGANTIAGDYDFYWQKVGHNGPEGTPDIEQEVG